MPERPPFPQYIDSTLRASFVACPRKFELTYLHHWKPQLPNVHLHAGGAFARGLEVARRRYHQQKSAPEEALSDGAKELIRAYGDFECPADSAKSCQAMVGALAEYFHHYGFATDRIQPYIKPDGSPAVEFSFVLPIDDSLTHPTTGDPLLYSGRFDLLGVFQDQLWVVDEKTATQLGKSWFNNWNLRSQLTGYCWAARQFDYPVAGAIIRGIAIRKYDYGHAESIQRRPEWFIERWRQQLIRDLRRMISCWEDGYFDYNLDDACSNYGGCVYQEICTSPHPERWLSAHFEQRVWDPLAHTETRL